MNPIIRIFSKAYSHYSMSDRIRRSYIFWKHDRREAKRCNAKAGFIERIFAEIDRSRSAVYLRASKDRNSSTNLMLMQQALQDAEDTLKSISQALDENNSAAAKQYAEMGLESVGSHIEELRNHAPQ